jgi:MFS-type transporter involved in bile tolerance (Atg22 family)
MGLHGLLLGSFTFLVRRVGFRDVINTVTSTASIYKCIEMKRLSLPPTYVFLGLIFNAENGSVMFPETLGCLHT